MAQGQTTAGTMVRGAAALVPETTDALSPFSMANMIHDYAKTLHAGSYDKSSPGHPGGRFLIQPEEALRIATVMFTLAFNEAAMRRRCAAVAEELGMEDAYAVVCTHYVKPETLIPGLPPRIPATTRP